MWYFFVISFLFIQGFDSRVNCIRKGLKGCKINLEKILDKGSWSQPVLKSYVFLLKVHGLNPTKVQILS